MGLAETCKALSDPVRRDILLLLRDGPRSAGEIGAHFPLTGGAVSYHLGQLRRAELIRERREKNFIYYELNTSVVEDAILWFRQLCTPTEAETKEEGHES